MKRLIIAAVITLALPAAALAYKLPASYQAVYCYPSGSYWQAQINAYPYYYSVPAINAYYSSHYGAGTIYCP